MAVTDYVTETFESGSNGASLTTGNTSSDLIGGTAPTFINTPIPFAGTLSMRVNIGGTAALSTARFPYGALRALTFLSFYIQAPSSWNAGTPSPVNVRSGSTIKSDLQISSGTFRLRGGGTGTTLVYTAPSAMATATWYWCEYMLDQAAGKQSLNCYDLFGTPLFKSGLQTWAAAATLDNCVLGLTASIANVQWYIDKLKVSNASNWRAWKRKRSDGFYQPLLLTRAP